MQEKSLSILENAIADVGYWRWWVTKNDTCQIEFGGVQLYACKQPEKESQSSVVALSFSGGSQLTFFADDSMEANWYQKLQEDKIKPFPIDSENFRFNDASLLVTIQKQFKHQICIKNKDVHTNTISLAFKAGPVAIHIAADTMQVFSHPGDINDGNILDLHSQWWDYWKKYWAVRDTKDAYKQDYACEVTLPIKS